MAGAGGATVGWYEVACGGVAGGVVERAGWVGGDDEITVMHALGSFPFTIFFDSVSSHPHRFLLLSTSPEISSSSYFDPLSTSHQHPSTNQSFSVSSGPKILSTRPSSHPSHSTQRWAYRSRVPQDSKWSHEQAAVKSVGALEGEEELGMCGEYKVGALCT